MIAMSSLSSLEERFWAKVNKTDSTDECWEWTAAKQKKGYGNFFDGSAVRLAHRISYELAFGPIPDGLQCCHKCDNPGCVNPHHIFLGTHKDNMADRDAKGRLNPNLGESHHNSRLTEFQLMEIRELLANGETQVSIADAYGIDQTYVSKIKQGITWAHVLGGPVETPPRTIRKGVRLDPPKVREIRRRYLAGEKQQSIANAFGIGNDMVSRVCARKVWKNVE